MSPRLCLAALAALAPLGAAAQALTAPHAPAGAPPFHAQFGAAEAEACIAALPPGEGPIECFDAFHDRLEHVLPAVETAVRARLAAEHGDAGPLVVSAFDDAQEAWGTSLWADLLFTSAAISGVSDAEGTEASAEAERVVGRLLVDGYGARIDWLVQRFGLGLGDLDISEGDIEGYTRPDRP